MKVKKKNNLTLEHMGKEFSKSHFCSYDYFPTNFVLMFPSVHTKVASYGFDI